MLRLTQGGREAQGPPAMQMVPNQAGKLPFCQPSLGSSLYEQSTSCRNGQALFLAESGVVPMKTNTNSPCVGDVADGLDTGMLDMS